VVTGVQTCALPICPGLFLKDTLVGGAGTAFTVYNPNASFVLKIPPACAGMPVYISAGKKAIKHRQCEWLAWFKFQNSRGDGLNPVYFGYVPENTKTTFLQEPPCFGNIRVSIFDPESQKFFGHAVVHDISNGGVIVRLAFHNGSNSFETIKSFLGKSPILPDGCSVRFFDPMQNKWTNQADTFSLSTPPNSRQIVFAGMGKQSFFSDIGALLSEYKMQLTLVYPNPCSNKLMVSYTLPCLVQDVKEIIFKIYNLQGKTVWSKKLTNGFIPGENSLVFDRKNVSGGKLASGIYILRMNVVSDNINKNLSFTRQLSFVY
jgi:hypothetical protein